MSLSRAHGRRVSLMHPFPGGWHERQWRVWNVRQGFIVSRRTELCHAGRGGQNPRGTDLVRYEPAVVEVIDAVQPDPIRQAQEARQRASSAGDAASAARQR